MRVNPTAKRCPRCGEVKALSDFYSRFRRGRWEPQSVCKACERQRVRDPEKGHAHVRRYAAKPENKVKIRAQHLVRYAVKKGELIKPIACERCGQIAPLDGHHHDYDKPLEVEWLCRFCHKAEHRRLAA